MKTGKIKATYAELFGSDGKKIFVVQKADAGDMVCVYGSTIGDKFTRVGITDQCLDLIREKMAKRKAANKVIEDLKQNGAVVKTSAFNWSEGVQQNTKKILIGAAALLLLLGMKNRKE